MASIDDLERSDGKITHSNDDEIYTFEEKEEKERAVFSEIAQDLLEDRKTQIAEMKRRFEEKIDPPEPNALEKETENLMMSMYGFDEKLQDECKAAAEERGMPILENLVDPEKHKNLDEFLAAKFQYGGSEIDNYELEEMRSLIESVASDVTRNFIKNITDLQNEISDMRQKMQQMEARINNHNSEPLTFSDSSENTVDCKTNIVSTTGKTIQFTIQL